MIHYTGVNHLAMATGDLATTIRFWRDLLGMRLVAGLGHPGYRHYFFEISPTDTIAFFEWPDVEPGPEKDHGAPVKGPHTFDHVSIGVASDEDLWALKDKLEAADVWVSEIIDHGFIHSLYSFDPNNIAIEFSAPAGGIDLRAQPLLADTEPSPEALEGPEPRPDVWPPVTDPLPADQRRLYEGMGTELAEGIRNRFPED